MSNNCPSKDLESSNWNNHFKKGCLGYQVELSLRRLSAAKMRWTKLVKSVAILGTLRIHLEKLKKKKKTYPRRATKKAWQLVVGRELRYLKQKLIASLPVKNQWLED